MANKIVDSVKIIPEADKIYTPQLINKAKGKLCNICDKYITDSEAEGKVFCYIKTRRSNEVFVHTKCLNLGGE